MQTLQNFEKIPSEELTAKFLEEAPQLEERDKARLQRRLFADSLSGLWDEMSQGMSGFDGYKMLRLSLLFDPGDVLKDIQNAYKALMAFSAWQRVEDAIIKARRFLSGPFVIWSLMIADRTRPEVMEKFKGTVGFGSIPPYLLIGIWPSKYSLVHLSANASREYHHVMRSSLFPINAIRYPLINSLVAEGLAENFVEELYGEEYVLNTTHSLDRKGVDKFWSKFSKSAKLNGVDQHKPFMYGGYRTGLPYGAGFAVGYHIVKSFRKNTGAKARDIVTLPARKILSQSDFDI